MKDVESFPAVLTAADGQSPRAIGREQYSSFAAVAVDTCHCWDKKCCRSDAADGLVFLSVECGGGLYESSRSSILISVVSQCDDGRLLVHGPACMLHAALLLRGGIVTLELARLACSLGAPINLCVRS